jgi:predicted XRE-type DNA-binding protein
MKKAKPGSVFEQLGFDRQESAALRLRSQMMNALIAEMERSQMTQAALAKRLGISQPRVSDLLRGKLHLFSIDMLISLLAQLGLDVRVKVSKRAA